MTETTRSLERGLALLSALERQGSAGLADLARRTGLPKATASRLLASLVACGWAERRLNDGRFLPALPARRADPAQRLRAAGARAGAHHLPALTAASGLPADLTLLVATGILEVIDSTRERRLGGVDPKVAGFRPSLVFSAPGRAFLAACDDEGRQSHLKHLLQGDSPAERFAVTSGAFAEELEKSRQRGYALRAPGYWPDSSDYGAEPMDLAVPLIGAEGPFGSLSLVWPAAERQSEAVVAQWLPLLRRTAEALARSLEGASG